MQTTSSEIPMNFREPDGLGRKNVTRRTRNLPRKLLREGKLHLLPVYWLLMQRDMESSPDTPFGVLAIPSGIPRDLLEVADQLRNQHPAWLARIHYTGVD